MTSPTAVSTCDLVVLGGGAAGLTAAWRAALAGKSAQLFERSAALGGLAASFEVAGVRVDHGSHRLHPSTPPALLADLRALLGADLQIRPRRGRLRLYDRWLSFPLKPTEITRTVPATALRRITRDSICTPFRLAGWSGSDDRASSYGGALRTSLGPELYAPYAVKLWGLPRERIDVEQARRRVSADSPWKIARRVFSRRRVRGRRVRSELPRAQHQDPGPADRPGLWPGGMAAGMVAARAGRRDDARTAASTMDSAASDARCRLADRDVCRADHARVLVAGTATRRRTSRGGSRDRLVRVPATRARARIERRRGDVGSGPVCRRGPARLVGGHDVGGGAGPGGPAFPAGVVISGQPGAG